MYIVCALYNVHISDLNPPPLMYAPENHPSVSLHPLQGAQLCAPPPYGGFPAITLSSQFRGGGQFDWHMLCMGNTCWVLNREKKKSLVASEFDIYKIYVWCIIYMCYKWVHKINSGHYIGCWIKKNWNNFVGMYDVNETCTFASLC